MEYDWCWKEALQVALTISLVLRRALAARDDDTPRAVMDTGWRCAVRWAAWADGSPSRRSSKAKIPVRWTNCAKPDGKRNENTNGTCAQSFNVSGDAKVTSHRDTATGDVLASAMDVSLVAAQAPQCTPSCGSENGDDAESLEFARAGWRDVQTSSCKDTHVALKVHKDTLTRV